MIHTCLPAAHKIFNLTEGLLDDRNTTRGGGGGILKSLVKRRQPKIKHLQGMTNPLAHCLGKIKITVF